MTEDERRALLARVRRLDRIASRMTQPGLLGISAEITDPQRIRAREARKQFLQLQAVQLCEGENTGGAK